MSATKALAWKEWREQRLTVLVGIVMSIATPFVMIAGSTTGGGRLDLAGLADVLPMVFAALLVPLLAAAAGGATIASELGEGTLGFLLSRPVPRARIWSVKIAIGAAATLAILLGSLVVAWIFALVTHPGESGFSIREILSKDSAGLAVVAALSGTALLFCASVFFSTFLSRAMNAAGAGLAASSAMIAVLFMILSRLDIVPRLEPGLFVLEVLLAALAFLMGSLYLFCRGELQTGRGAMKRAILVLGISMTLLAFLAIPALSAQWRLSPSAAVLAGVSLNGAGDTLVATAVTREGMSPEVWVIPTDGSGLTRPTGRLTFSPAFSPDGKRLAFLSVRGMLGLRSDSTEVRVMNIDGSGEIAIATSFRNTSMRGDRVDLAFCPDGSHIALTDGSTLMIAPLQGEAVTQVDLVKTPLLGGRVVGWTNDGSEVLMLASIWKPAASSTLAAVGVTDGAIRVLHNVASGHIFLPMGWREDRSWKQIPLLIDPDTTVSGGISLIILDLDDGVTTPISLGVCPGAIDLSADGSLLAYATCPPNRTADMTSDLHLVDMKTWIDLAAGQFAGKAWRILISPTKEKLLIHRFRPGGGTLPTAIVDMDGSTRELAPGWIPVGWQGRERVVLADATDDWQIKRLAVADAGTGEMRPFYPTPR